MPSDFDHRLKAFSDISCLIGAQTAVRKGDLTPEMMKDTMISIVSEWNDVGMLLVFLQAFVGVTERLHARVAEEEGLSPEQLLQTRFRTLMGE